MTTDKAMTARGNSPSGPDVQKPDLPNAGTVVPTQKSAGNILETYIKLLGLAGAVSASMGLPAVYLHFKQLGIPTYYIDYQLVLSAGIFPVIIIVLIALYFRGILKQTRGNGEALPIYSAILIPLILPVLPFLIVGMFAYILLLSWAIAWVLQTPFKKFGLLQLDNRELLYVGMIIIAITAVIYVFRNHLLKLKAFRKILNSRPISLFLNSQTRLRQKQTGTNKPVKPRKPNKTKEEEAREWLPLLPIMWLVIPAMCVGLLYAMKAVLYLWKPGLEHALSTSTIMWLGISLGFLYALFMSSFASIQFFECDSRRMKNVGLSIVIASLLIGAIFFISLYTLKIYPVLNQAWGGGKPESVTVWLSKDDLPSIRQIHNKLPAVKVIREDKLVRIGPTQTLTTGKQMILLNNAKASRNAIVLPLENIKMVAH